MNNTIFELKNFKDYLPLWIDISDKDYLMYQPLLAPSILKKSIEPALTEEELYFHMKNVSGWSFSNQGNQNYFKQDCIEFLRDIDFQSFLVYGKLTNLNFARAKSAYLFDSYLRNFLQSILERIEIFLKKVSLMQSC